MLRICVFLTVLFIYLFVFIYFGGFQCLVFVYLQTVSRYDDGVKEFCKSSARVLKKSWHAKSAISDQKFSLRPRHPIKGICRWEAFWGLGQHTCTCTKLQTTGSCTRPIAINNRLPKAQTSHILNYLDLLFFQCSWDINPSVALEKEPPHL